MSDGCWMLDVGCWMEAIQHSSFNANPAFIAHGQLFLLS